MPKLPAKLPRHHVRRTASGSYSAGWYDAKHRFRPTFTGSDLEGAVLFATAANAATVTVTAVRRTP